MQRNLVETRRSLFASHAAKLYLVFRGSYLSSFPPQVIFPPGHDHIQRGLQSWRSTLMNWWRRKVGLLKLQRKQILPRHKCSGVQPEVCSCCTLTSWPHSSDGWHHQCRKCPGWVSDNHFHSSSHFCIERFFISDSAEIRNDASFLE